LQLSDAPGSLGGRLFPPCVLCKAISEYLRSFNKMERRSMCLKDCINKLLLMEWSTAAATLPVVEIGTKKNVFNALTLTFSGTCVFEGGSILISMSQI
jgi:hypothetical protein